ncbi:nucleolus and neural progenitor protein isoform 2-T2 [Anomaloglossus baeobatrachus]|uniref:nucleolus and neural progenitor protein isoform X2 n=1 Tax=Anomaloglossus baeobatrachus TaxID=238106 RepID=UPI003F509A77
MAAEPWNRLHIPRPAIQCQLSVPLGENTEKCMKTLIDQCSTTHSFLKSETLNTEVRTLDTILYAYHHQLSCHKPYLALKQVQQCTKRIKTMGLEGSIEEMMDLCPKQTELEDAQYCTVPSQPILELVSMKILGSCKLLVRLMDCCCKAFHLCLQHLNLEEFVVMYIVLLGLLSRLWVLYRGLLKRLIALYSTHIRLQKEVSDVQKMPYFKGFVYPDSIQDHLGSVFNDLITSKLPKLFSEKGKAQFLQNMFDSSNLAKGEKRSKNRDVKAKEPKGTDVDLGEPIKLSRVTKGDLKTFDVKALLQPVKASGLQGLDNKKSNESNKRRLSKHNRKKKCVKHLVPKIEEAEDFQGLSKQLVYAIKWCKEKELKTEVAFFRNRYLRCHNLQYAEALGQSLKKKLRCWKKSMCHSLREQTLRRDHLETCLRMQRFQRAWRHMVTGSQRHRRPKRKSLGSRQCLELSPGQKTPSATAPASLKPRTSKPQKSSSTKGTERGLTDTDDIDDIFSSIGI